MAYHLPKPPERCRRCGRFDCDKLEPGELERLAAKLARMPTLPREDHQEDMPEPLL